MSSNKKIKLAVFIGSLRRGGAEIQLKEILPKLSKDIFLIDVFLLSSAGGMEAEIKSKDINIIYPWFDTKNKPLSLPLRIIRIIILYTQLLVYFISKRPDIVHCFLPQSYCLVMPVALITRIKIRIVSRLSLNNYRFERKFMWYIECFLHNFMSKIIVNAGVIAQQLIDLEGVSPEKIKKIYSGVNTDIDFNSDKKVIRAKLDIKPDSFTMVMVANLIPYKGHLDLIKALASISHKLPPEWTMLFVGRDDGIKSLLVKEIHGQGISENCIFIHSDNDIFEYYKCADIGILTSHEEGLSVSVLEAMSMSLPMVVTDVGGNAESVINSENGYVVNAKDYVGIGEAILKLSSDGNCRKLMGSANRRRVIELFSIDNAVSLHEKLYLELISCN